MPHGQLPPRRAPDSLKPRPNLLKSGLGSRSPPSQLFLSVESMQRQNQLAPGQGGCWSGERYTP